MDQETQEDFKKQLQEMAEELRTSVNKTDATDAVQLDSSDSSQWMHSSISFWRA